MSAESFLDSNIILYNLKIDFLTIINPFDSEQKV